ncbi:MAG TPA: FHA domain-containing protein [Gammaproteobacteria bacterium]|nr:FHA domain-containing protein [Gammaproteobacteria bacterium]
MPTLAIEINDSGLVVADAETVLAVEPGYALVDGGKITTGAAAFGQARLKPRRISNRFWANLSVAPDTAGVPGAGSAAELAFAQLRDLWARVRDGAGAADVVFVVPGHYTREQLGVLLGLAEECRMRVKALVDAAVAASARPYPGRQLLYVDASLHRVSVTPLDQADEAVALNERGLDSGRAEILDSIARWLAEIFVLTTRFDPFHHAEAEQRLYDSLPDWLSRFSAAESAEVVVPHRNEEFRVTVEREQLLGVLSGFHRALVQLIAQVREPDAGVVVQISERLADLPGLASHLSRLDGSRIVRLPAGHAARAVLKGIDELESGGAVRLLKHLPWREAPAEADDTAEAMPAEEPRDDAMPTHVVYRGIAYPLSSAGLLIGRGEQEGRRTIIVEGEHGGVSRSHCELALRDGELKLRDLSRHGTFVNERRVLAETVLKPGDMIRIGSPGAELQIIRVES